MKKNFENGYALVKADKKIHEFIIAAVESWKEFLNQTEYQKEKFNTNVHYGGFRSSIKKEQNFRKDFFDLTLDYIESLEFSGGSHMTNIDYLFINNAGGLLELLSQPVYEFANLLTEDSSTDFYTAIFNIKEKWVLRFLYYPPSITLEEGATHADINAGTIHLYESHPGLKYLWNDQWNLIKAERPYLACFPSLRGQYYAQCNVNGLWHCVETTPESQREGRYSAVLFLPIDIPQKYNKEKYGAVQDAFKPGETYGMSFEKFSKYFV